MWPRHGPRLVAALDPGVDMGCTAEIPHHRWPFDLPHVPHSIVSDGFAPPPIAEYKPQMTEDTPVSDGSRKPINERLLLLVLAAIQFTAIVDFLIILPLGPQYLRLFHISPAQ